MNRAGGSGAKVPFDPERNLAEFVGQCREELTLRSDGAQWESPVWPGARWVKVTVGKRGEFTDSERLDPEFVLFAKAYCVFRRSERRNRVQWYLQALRCLESALVTHTGSGSLQGLTWAVLDEAAVVAGERFSPGVRYQVGREIGEIARFVTSKRLIGAGLSTWKSSFARPTSVQRTGRVARERAKAKLPSQNGLHAMAELFANDPAEPQQRFVTSVWALLLCAPWRIGEVLALHVDAEHEEPDDAGEIVYGFRYFGKKGFGHGIKFVPKVMEPLAREAFRRLREMTESARALSKHLETTPEKPFLYPDTPTCDVDNELTLEERAAYLRKPVPVGSSRSNAGWRFRTIREHWEGARARVPKRFPLFAADTGLRYSDALFCTHRNLLHETRPVDWYGLWAPDANCVNVLLGSQPTKIGVLEKLGYKEPDGSLVRLHTHQARHYVSTIAERGSMGQEDLAEWAGRALARDNRAYNHMSEPERVERKRRALEGTSLAPSSAPSCRLPTTPQACNLGAPGPVQRTEFGVCEHDWVASPCMKNRDCFNCSEHAYVKGDATALARIKAQQDHHTVECTKALDAVLDGAGVADRWLEHGLKTVVHLEQLMTLLESDDVEEGSVIRLSGAGDITHLSRALEQRLPKLRDPLLPESIRELIGRHVDGEPPVC